MDPYYIALNETIAEKTAAVNKFNVKKARDEAKINVAGEIDLPLGTELIKESLKSDAAKNVLKAGLKKYTGLSDEEIERLTTALQDGNVTDAANVSVDALKTRAARALSYLKEKINDSYTNKISDLKQKTQGEIDSLREKYDDIESEFNSTESETIKRALKKQMDDIVSEVAQKKADLSDLVSNLKDEGNRALKSLLEKAGNLKTSNITPENVNALESKVSELGDVEPTLNTVIDNNPVSRVMESLREPGVTGSDSTIARALQAGEEGEQHLSGILNDHISSIEGLRSYNKPETDLLERGQQAAQDIKQSLPRSDAVEEIVPQTEEQATGLLSKAGKTAQQLLKSTASGAEDAAEGVGEGVGEAVGEAIGEATLGDLIAPGIGLIAGVGTLVGQIVGGIEEAKKKPNISAINPSVSYGFN